DFSAFDTVAIVLYNSIFSGNLGFTGVVPDDSAAGLPDTDPNQAFGNDIGTTAGVDASFFINQAPNITGTQFSPDPEDVFISTNFAGLAPLGNYGGATQTQPPLDTTSPAFNAGDNAFAVDPGDDIILADADLLEPDPVDDDSPLTTDQRLTTPRSVYDTVDIGAAEYRLAGDANLDGDVNLTDFLTLRSNFNLEGIFSDGDFNGDGDINLTDFLILRANFNSSINS
ncbi:MAG: choice-of-anchor Q domain-containing protein, partial [Planctomycetota bacterium]